MASISKSHGKRTYAKSHHYSVGIFFTNFADQQCAHSGTGATANRVCELEALLRCKMYLILFCQRLLCHSNDDSIAENVDGITKFH